MTKYVAGLLFNTDSTAVALCLKQRGPARLIGNWNGIGGKVEPGESDYNAMCREFKEETGVHVSSWAHFLTLKGDGWEVAFFRAFNTEKLSQIKQMESEPITEWSLDSLPVTVPNMSWIIPMALTCGTDNVRVYETIEKETM